MNNEPVAWVYLEKWMAGIAYADECFSDEELKGTTPLYTHPAKTLTDELKALLYSVNGDCYLGKEKEEALVAQVRKQYSEPAKTLTDEEIIEIGNAVTNLIDSNEGWIEFARAILKKASEK